MRRLVWDLWDGGVEKLSVSLLSLRLGYAEGEIARIPSHSQAPDPADDGSATTNLARSGLRSI